MEIRAYSPLARVAPPSASEAPDPTETTKIPTFRRADPSRQVRTTPDANSLQATLAQIAARPSQLRRMLRALGDDNSTDVAQLSEDAAAHVRAGGSLADFGAKAGLDPASLQLVGLRAALDRDAADPALAQTLRRQLESLQDASGTAIAAAINTAVALGSLQHPAADKAWLRGMYLSVLQASVPVLDAFESLLQKYGVNAFESGALAMLRALTDDMKAPRSSIAPDRLQMLLLSSMVTVRHLLALAHTCRAFLRQPVEASRHSGRVTAIGEEAADEGEGRGGDDAEPGRRQEDDGEAQTQTQARNGADGAEEERRSQATLRMMRLVLQLVGSSAAVKMVPAFLDEEVVPRTRVERAARVRNEFIDVMRSLPPGLWKDPKLKDQLIELLRRQSMTDPNAS